MKNQSLMTLGYYQVLERLKEYAFSASAKERIGNMKPLLSELELKKHLRDTSQARSLTELYGTPPLPAMDRIDEYIEKAAREALLLPEELEEIGMFLNSVRRLKAYLQKGEDQQISLAFYNQNLEALDDLAEEIQRCIRNRRVDDYASPYLKDIRKQMILLSEKIGEKAERALKANQAYLSDSFVVKRNGRYCIPVRKKCRNMVAGTVVEQSSTGATIFMEPASVSEFREELEIYQIEEDSEERRILYTLMNLTAEHEAALRENIRVIEKLDFMFAKGRLSLDMDAVEPEINLEHYIRLEKARHPMLSGESCVPLDFEIGKSSRGVVITGPNTGGKTVAIKTVALMSAMACSGLHVPCRKAEICMNNEILCDIGDGQDISDNLSTFSAHIKNVLEILKRSQKDSLVILDELGSGTDPAEGMGIAVAILQELRNSGALFLVTTHYPEVKEYANRYPEVVNARMEFDRESLKPLYRLKVGEAGESCALYIAKRLGFPGEMLCEAAKEAYGEKSEAVIDTLQLSDRKEGLKREKAPSIQKIPPKKEKRETGRKFITGDSVTVLPEEQIGIVVRPSDENGRVLVQIKKEKKLYSHKRLRLKVAAEELYPEDYDFSIIFDSVENRKARHKMGKGYRDDLVIRTDE
ncbi:endonuclease MutS2 [Anaerostipes sp.]|uniref:endonuclease MutS2 n=1 Tax=Anaerostipes sp. TaxID=1872530 RepID=UPI0025BA921F|nr:DNA mismatch repair protein MutS [Anaerostipes sp.]MBS7009322.1 DNA mismatch repair protein MutS [Anaerostipes sp.]